MRLRNVYLSCALSNMNSYLNFSDLLNVFEIHWSEDRKRYRPVERDSMRKLTCYALLHINQILEFPQACRNDTHANAQRPLQTPN